MQLLGFALVLLLIAAGLLGPGRDYTAYGLWWLTNNEAPELQVSGPAAGAVRGVLEIPVASQPADRVDLVSAEVDGSQVEVEARLRLDTSTLPDGEHKVLVRAQDRSWRHNPSSATVQFRSDNTPPKFELQPSPAVVPQGHTVVIYLRPSEPSDIQARLAGLPLRLWPAGNDFWAIVGVDADEPPGKKELVAEGRDRVGNSGRSTGELAIDVYKFTKDALQVPANLLPLLQPDLRASEDEKLGQVYQSDNGPPIWKGSFTLPVRGPISTEFGEVRSYNGGPFAGHHGGTDFQVGPGTPVLAPAHARVAFREEVKVRGRVLILDHGGSVFTTYAHLAEWTVDLGQEVQQGQAVAKVGTTGLSTGPHLHWEFWVGNKNVDPLEWTEREIP